MKKKVNILNVDFDQLSLSETVNEIEKMIKKGGNFHIGTMNPEYVVRSQSSKQLRGVIAKMDLVLPDGVGIVLAAKWKKAAKLSRIRGGDLVEAIGALCEKNKSKIGLIGGEKGIAKKALQSLQAKFPKLIGFADPGPPLKEYKEIIIRIKKEKPQVLFTALSFQGSIWIDNLLKDLRKEKISLVALEVGGVFNYLAGKSPQPPKVVQRIGLEWFWRLITEPWRWKRQLALLKFVFLLFHPKPKKP